LAAKHDSPRLSCYYSSAVLHIQFSLEATFTPAMSQCGIITSTFQSLVRQHPTLLILLKLMCGQIDFFPTFSTILTSADSQGKTSTGNFVVTTHSNNNLMDQHTYPSCLIVEKNSLADIVEEAFMTSTSEQQVGNALSYLSPVRLFLILNHTPQFRNFFTSRSTFY
jgi:hypothetical protein